MLQELYKKREEISEEMDGFGFTHTYWLNEDWQTLRVQYKLIGELIEMYITKNSKYKIGADLDLHQMD
jgi:hypothetical protein